MGEGAALHPEKKGGREVSQHAESALFFFALQANTFPFTRAFESGTWVSFLPVLQQKGSERGDPPAPPPHFYLKVAGLSSFFSSGERCEEKAAHVAKEDGTLPIKRGVIFYLPSGFTLENSLFGYLFVALVAEIFALK